MVKAISSLDNQRAGKPTYRSIAGSLIRSFADPADDK
jgi:hypothetical protein